MKVLMFGWEFPPYISGGLGTACHGLTKGLSELNCQVTFVLPRLKGPDVTPHLKLLGANQVSPVMTKEEWERSREKLKFIHIDSSLQPYLTEETYRETVEEVENNKKKKVEQNFSVIDVSGDYGHDLISEVFRFAAIGGRLGLTEDFDVIHAHDWMTYPAAIEARASSGKPLIVHVHATEFDRTGDNPNEAIYDIERRGMFAADRIIAVSHRTKDMIVRKYHVPWDKIEVVHNAVAKDKGVERHEIKKGFKEKVVLFLGRVTLQKGPDYFVEAAHKVYKKVNNVRFVMAGAGDMLPRMIERAAQLRLVDRFHFTGFLKGRKLEEMYSMSDVYVMPSVSEPFGITPFEAIKYGVPIIISKQSGISEVLDQVIKVDFWDIDKLSSAIVDVLERPGVAEKMIVDSSRELEQIDWRNPADKVLNIYRRIVDL